MELKITEQKENLLLNRKELFVLIGNKGTTPKKEELAGKLGALLNIDKNLVVVERLNQKFGAQTSIAYVKVYNTTEYLKKTEPKKKEKKAKAPAGEAAAAAPAPVVPAKEEKK